MTGAGWAPDNQEWLLIDLTNTVSGVAQCSDYNVQCEYAMELGWKASTFTMSTNSGQTVQPFGSAPNGQSKELLYQVTEGTTVFTLTVNTLVNLDDAHQIEGTAKSIFDPPQLNFTHTNTLAFQ